jgi:hypothetical protein
MDEFLRKMGDKAHIFYGQIVGVLIVCCRLWIRNDIYLEVMGCRRGAKHAFM